MCAEHPLIFCVHYAHTLLFVDWCDDKNIEMFAIVPESLSKYIAVMANKYEHVFLQHVIWHAI